MSDVYKATSGDVFVDKQGKLWRVLWTCAEPSLKMVAVEAPFEEQEGGQSGMIWDGFRRILSIVEIPPKKASVTGGGMGI